MKRKTKEQKKSALAIAIEEFENWRNEIDSMGGEQRKSKIKLRPYYRRRHSLDEQARRERKAQAKKAYLEAIRADASKHQVKLNWWQRLINWVFQFIKKGIKHENR